MAATKTAKMASGGILALLFGGVNVVVQKGYASMVERAGPGALLTCSKSRG
jgi:hypothetical protein